MRSVDSVLSSIMRNLKMADAAKRLPPGGRPSRGIAHAKHGRAGLRTAAAIRRLALPSDNMFAKDKHVVAALR